MSATPADHVVALLWEGRADEAAVVLRNCESPVAEALTVGLVMAGQRQKTGALVSILRSQETAGARLAAQPDIDAEYPPNIELNEGWK